MQVNYVPSAESQGEENDVKREMEEGYGNQKDTNIRFEVPPLGFSLLSPGRTMASEETRVKSVHLAKHCTHSHSLGADR